MNKVFSKNFFNIILFSVLPIIAQVKPNIILFMADDWGYGDVAAYGKGMPSPLAPGGIQQNLLTPNLDQMAAEGTMYTQFYVNAAVCSPTRVCVMKGQFTRRHGVNYHYEGRANAINRGMPIGMPETTPVLTNLVKDAGYATAHFGKWHMTAWDATDAPVPADYGIDEHMVSVGSGAGNHRMPLTETGWTPFPGVLLSGTAKEAWRAQASEEIIDSSISFIERNVNNPFYLNVWVYDTHGRLYTTPAQMAPYSALSNDLQVYYGAATDTDIHFGRLMARIKALGIDSNTIVLFHSDNGPEVKDIDQMSGAGSTAGLRGMKRSGYEGGIRSPFIVRWPGSVPAGRVDSTTVLSGADLLSTLVSLAGGAVPASSEVDGQNMTRAIKGLSTARTRPLLWHMGENVHDRANGYWTNPKVIIRDGKWKLFQNPDGSGVELYDIMADPFEENEISASNPAVVAALQALIGAWVNGNTNITSRTGLVPNSSQPWPIKGCMEPTAPNYNNQANLDDGSCATPVVNDGFQSKSVYEIKLNSKGYQFILERDKPIKVSLFNLDGRLYRSYTFTKKGIYPLNDVISGKLYILRVQIENTISKYELKLF